MEEELDFNEEQAEEVVEEVASSADDSVITTTITDDVIPFNTSEDVPALDASEDTSYSGDEDLHSIGSPDEESSEDKFGSLDCRSECKYNTGNRSKYANYGWSD